MADPYFRSITSHFDLCASCVFGGPVNSRGYYATLDSDKQARIRAFVASEDYLSAREPIAEAFQNFERTKQ